MYAKNIHIHLYWGKTETIKTRHTCYQYLVLLGIHKHKIPNESFGYHKRKSRKHLLKIDPQVQEFILEYINVICLTPALGTASRTLSLEPCVRVDCKQYFIS